MAFSEVFHEKSGFDVAIGNPPYVQLQKLPNDVKNRYRKQNYQTYDSNGDIYCLFYEKGMACLKPAGHLVYITSNKWMRAGYGEKLRQFFLKNNPQILVDLGPGIFESATVDTNIFVIEKSENKARTLCATVNKENNQIPDIADCLRKKGAVVSNFSQNTWFIGIKTEIDLKKKIEKIGVPLKDWDVKINYGIKTGLNDAFIINTETRDALVAEDPKSAEVIKPILRGRDIKRYSYHWAGLWLLMTGYDLDVPKKYSAVYKHLLQFEERARKRDDQGKNWWNLRACVYYSDFEKEKVVYPNMTKFLPFYFDDNGFYTNQKCFILSGTNLKYLAGYFNSKMAGKWIKDNCPELQGGTRELSKIFFENIIIPPIIPENRSTVKEIEQTVEQILAAKQDNLAADTTDLENQIDQLVYQLYDLTKEEIEIVENLSKGNR